MTIESDIELHEKKFRRHTAMMFAASLPYSTFTEMKDEPRLAHNDETNEVDAGADSGHQDVDSSD